MITFAQCMRICLIILCAYPVAFHGYPIAHTLNLSTVRMKRIKNICKKIFGSSVLKYVVVIVVGCFVVGFMDENSIWSHLQNKEKSNNLQTEINDYKERHTRDEAQLEALENDHKAVEKVAREKYYMKLKDEDIFVLSTDRK